MTTIDNPPDAIMTERQQRHARLTYLAIWDGRNGYALDCYPEELPGVRRDYGKQVIGEFATGDEAFSAVKAKMAADCAALNAREGKSVRLSTPRSAPISVICPACKYGYARGLPGEARLHAAFHASYMHQRKPRPEPRLAAFGGDVRVDAASQRWLHRIVYRCALALKRDERYDFPQWREDRPPEGAAYGDLHAVVLVEDGVIPVGAVGFSWTKWKDHTPGWRMNFAWVADDWRRQGVMARRWTQWRETYGDFTLERPLSAAMKAFVAKMNADDDLDLSEAENRS
jgi:hypothetical protein